MTCLFLRDGCNSFFSFSKTKYLSLIGYLITIVLLHELIQFQQYFHYILLTLKYMFFSSVAELTGNFLKREWFRPDGERESGAKYNEALQFLLR